MAGRRELAAETTFSRGRYSNINIATLLRNLRKLNLKRSRLVCDRLFHFEQCILYSFAVNMQFSGLNEIQSQLTAYIQAKLRVRLRFRVRVRVRVN